MIENSLIRYNRYHQIWSRMRSTYNFFYCYLISCSTTATFTLPSLVNAIAIHTNQSSYHPNQLVLNIKHNGYIGLPNHEPAAYVGIEILMNYWYRVKIIHQGKVLNPYTNLIFWEVIPHTLFNFIKYRLLHRDSRT